jgi:hypothetical protein
MRFSTRVSDHLRSNVVGYVAVFIAMSGTAYAVDGPLAGQNQVGSEDIINEEVKREDLGSNAVRTGKVLDETLLAEDVATGAISSSEVLNSTLTHFDLGPDSVRYPELAPGAFDPAEIAEIAPGFVFGIADDAIQSEEVGANSLNGADVASNSLTGADIDETTLGALDGNDAHDESCNPETDSYLRCVALIFNAGRPMSVLMMATYQHHGIDDNPLGRCRTTLDGATISSAKLFNSDHTSEIGGSQVDVVSVDPGTHTFGFDCIEDGPDDHDLVVNYMDLALVQLAND